MAHFRHLFTLLLTLTIYSVSFSAHSEEAHEYAASSLLSEGRWIKVRVDSTAIHRVPLDMLSEMGFNDPDNIIVAGYGSVEVAHSLDTAPDDLPILPVMRAETGVFFFGEGDERINAATSSVTIHRNYYSKGSYYFIGERAGFRSPEIPVSPVRTNEPDDTVTSHQCVVHTTFFEAHSSLRGLMSHSHDIVSNGSRTLSYHIPVCCGKPRLFYSFLWKHGNTAKQAFTPVFSNEISSASTGHNALLAKNSSTSNLDFSARQNDYAVLTPQTDADHFDVIFSAPDATFSFLALTNTTLVYPRLNRASTDERILNFRAIIGDDAISFMDAAPGLNIWNVTDPRNPVALTVSLQEADSIATVSMPEGFAGDAVLAAFYPDDGVRTPTVIGEIPTRSLHSMDDVEFLIVTTDALYPAAVRLAEAHRQWQGMKTAVVRQSEVFDEFSSGALHPNGIRRMVSMLAQRPTPLRYLLLMGHGSWDTRGEHHFPSAEEMVTYSTEDPAEMGYETKTYCSDLYFGITDSRISTSIARQGAKATVSVGRIPAYDIVSANEYVDKCIDYLSNPQLAGPFNHVIVSGGIGDASSHYLISEENASIINSLIPHPTLFRNHLSLFDKASDGKSGEAQQRLLTNFARGARAYIFNGHGSATFVDHSTFNNAAHRLTSYGSLPVFLLASCSGASIDLESSCLADQILYSNPGPIAVIGAGSEIYLNYNTDFIQSFSRCMFGPDGGECLGDVFRHTMAGASATLNLTTNSLNFNFLGDPALPRYHSTASAMLTEVNGIQVVEDNIPINVAEGSRVTLSGQILGADGEKDVSFNGSLRIDLYDAPHNIRTKPFRGDSLYVLSTDEEAILQISIPVTKGSWTTEIVVPTTSFTGSNRMTLNAVSDDRRIASGGCIALAITANGETETPVTDTVSPDINIWIDRPDSADGALTGSSILLHVDISDSGSGVSLNRSGIGLAPKIMLDGNPLTALSHLLRPDGNGSASMEYILESLDDGIHTIEVFARDNVGNSTSATRRFTVINTPVTATLSASTQIARRDVVFDLSHTFYDSPATSRLLIRNSSGDTVLSVDAPSFPFTWNLRDAQGLPVADGAYRASAILSSHPNYASTPEVRFTIVKHPDSFISK